MIEWVGGVWSGIKFVWRHRKTIALAGSVQGAIDEAHQLRIRVEEQDEEITRLKDELQQVRERLDLKESLDYRHDIFWTEPTSGYPKGIPVCPRCFQADERVVYMHFPNLEFICCKNCDHGVWNPDYTPPPLDEVSDRDIMTGY